MQRKRHGCLTAWLVLIIVCNSGALVMAYLPRGNEAFRQIFGWAFPVLIVLWLFTLVCAIALFQWKKWGFWGFCVSMVGGFVVELSAGGGGVGLITSLVGLIGCVALFYGVLHIGKENKGWPQLD